MNCIWYFHKAKFFMHAILMPNFHLLVENTKVSSFLFIMIIIIMDLFIINEKTNTQYSSEIVALYGKQFLNAISVWYDYSG